VSQKKARLLIFIISGANENRFSIRQLFNSLTKVSAYKVDSL